MCNLYSNTTAQEAMRQLFRIGFNADRLGNAAAQPAIFPKNQAPVVRLARDGEWELAYLSWGFPIPQTSKKTGNPIEPKAVNNARDDKVRSSGFWKRHFEARRCLIPATSFCEPRGRQPAVYHWFHIDGGEPFAFAGIWQRYRGKWREEDIELDVYSMLTTTPNATVAPIHPSRMPVILDPEDYETWISGPPDDAERLLRPFPAERMSVVAVGEGLK